MAIWVRVYGRRSTARVTAKQVHDGIARRLALMTYLVCPDDEEDPDVVARRLKVTATSIAYRTGRAMRLDRWSDRARVTEEVGEAFEALRSRRGRAVTSVRERLDGVVETVGIELQLSDARGMGWPVALSAACELCERGDGIGRADGLGWFDPSGNELDIRLGD
jgi:hypothetical protein